MRLRGATLVWLAALAGCASAPPPPSMDLDGEWQIVSLDRQPLIGTMRLDKGAMSISFGCNRASGTARIEGSRLVPAGPMAQTEMACANAVDGGPDPMAMEDKGFRIAGQPMWVASTRTPRRLRFWNEAGSFEADWISAIPAR